MGRRWINGSAYLGFIECFYGQLSGRTGVTDLYGCMFLMNIEIPRTKSIYHIFGEYYRLKNPGLGELVLYYADPGMNQGSEKIFSSKADNSKEPMNSARYELTNRA